jgi:hypothetical protein
MLSSFASLETVEQVFLLFPLVAAPLAVTVLSGLLFPGGREISRPFRAASVLLPPAAVAAVLSLFFSARTPAALLAAPWVVFAVLLGVGVLPQLGRAKALGVSAPCLAAGQLFLLAGAVWLLLSRLGVGPGGLSRPVVFLGAVHFHFTGFAGNTLVAATGPWVNALVPALRRVHRVVTVGAIAGIPAIAAGNVAALPALKLVGVLVVSATLVALAVLFALLAARLEDTPGKVLLGVAAASVSAGMVLAAIYGVGELTGAGWITLPQMARWHAPINAVGFTLLGLWGHVHLARRAALARVAAPAQRT